MQMATNSVGINIKQLPQINTVQSGDYLVVETVEGTGIIDYKDVVIDLEQTSFQPTIDSLVTGVVALSTNFNTLSSNIYSDLSDKLVGNVAVFKNISVLSAAQTFEGNAIPLPVNYIEANNISAQQNINTNSFTSCGDTTVSQTASAFVFDAGTYKVRIDARVTSLCSTPTWMQIFLYQDTLPLQVLQHGSSFAATGTNQIGNLFIDGYFYLCRTSQITLRATTYGRFNLGLPTQTMYAAASSNASLSADLLASLQLSSCNMSMFVQKVSDAATPATNKLAITL
jgi:hypothetical protein